MIKWVKKIALENHLVLSVFLTTLCCVVAFCGAFLLRFDLFSIPPIYHPCLWIGLPIMLAIRLVTLSIFKVHRGLYRYVSIHDFVNLSKAITLGTLVFMVLWMLLLNDSYSMPRSIFVLEALLSMSLLSGLRISVRLWRSNRQQRERRGAEGGAGRALIIGAGNMGETIFRMVDRRFLGKDLDVVGFVDDSAGMQKSSIHGVTVLGRLDAVPELVKEQGIEVVIFAIPTPPEGLYAGVLDSCEGLKVRFNTVSVLHDVSSGEVSFDRMRSLRVEDLLGRKSVEVDQTEVFNSIQNCTVLVTGAGGSIGSELCTQLAMFGPSKLILLDSAESPLFEIDRALRQKHPDLVIEPVIADIKNHEVIERVFREKAPEYVYHAAAYKHVPLMEAHPDEAVLNNVRGTRILAESAKKYHCRRFVMISSDKAVRPTNVMGATKRMCELVIQSMNGGDTIFTAVRFGNVLGSNGSVIPIFQKQLEAGGPLTVTHQEMTRYFMTIPEAVTLVLQCGSMATAGDIFVLDMGTPVRIIDLAKNMIRLSGLQENVDISIEVTGLRPGEKMFEELVAYGEELQETLVPKVNVLKRKKEKISYDELREMIAQLEGFAEGRMIEDSRNFLWELMEMDVAQSRGAGKGQIKPPKEKVI
ncbi:polysaccharide biosynthesis protein [Akkermansiaceae bacterium]|nr:polysaccharide biosynthesis protein [Akkermansiaceae bacterium]